MSEMSEVSEVLEVWEVSMMSSLPFPFFARRIDFKVLAEEQQSFPDLLCLKKSQTLRLITVMVEGSSLLCDAWNKVLRPLVPSSQRFKVFSALHSLSHPGICVWCGLAKDIRDYC